MGSWYTPLCSPVLYVTYVLLCSWRNWFSFCWAMTHIVNSGRTHIHTFYVTALLNTATTSQTR